MILFDGPIKTQPCCNMPQQDASPPRITHALRSRILVIDDGDSVRNIIGVFLENAGFEVCGEAADGVEGIEQAKKLKPDLIVLDLAMPRMNGVDAASVLNQTMPDVPIVLLTPQCWAACCPINAVDSMGRRNTSSKSAYRLGTKRRSRPLIQAQPHSG
jgi:hypothetical protein